MFFVGHLYPWWQELQTQAQNFKWESHRCIQLKFIIISLTIFWNYVTWQLPSTVSHLLLFFNALTCFRYFSQFKKWWSLRSSRANWWKGWQGLFEVFNVRTLFVSAVNTPKSVLNRTCAKCGKNKEVAQSCRRVCLWCFYHILTSSVIYYYYPRHYLLPTAKWNLFVLSEAYASGFIQWSEKKKKRLMHIRNLPSASYHLTVQGFVLV